MPTRHVWLLPAEGGRVEVRIESGTPGQVSSTTHDFAELADNEMLRLLTEAPAGEVSIDPAVITSIRQHAASLSPAADASLAAIMARFGLSEALVTKRPGMKPGGAPILRGASKNGLSDGGDMPAPDDGAANDG